jgi:transcriptional regulator with XRE-family HTH domain
MKPMQAAELRKKKGIQGTKLQQQRVQSDLSQQELADISGVSKRRIQAYEQKESSIDKVGLDVLCKLCLAIDCKIEDILEDEELIKQFKACK